MVMDGFIHTLPIVSDLEGLLSFVNFLFLLILYKKLALTELEKSLQSSHNLTETMPTRF